MRQRIKNTRFDLSVLLRLSIFAEYTRQPIIKICQTTAHDTLHAWLPRKLTNNQKAENKTMKTIKPLLLALTALIAACEKISIPDDGRQPQTEKTDDYDWKETFDIDSTEQRCLTVSEAIETDIGTVITVRGYIVGSTRRNMRNAKFLPPFDGKSAIILSDLKLTECEGFYMDELLPVCINDFTQHQDRLNLVDNPQLFERQITITGMKAIYLGQPGIKPLIWHDLTE